MVFLSAFVELMRHLDTEFDVVLDCIANGTIPDLDGVSGVRHHLEVSNWKSKCVREFKS